MKPIGGLAGLRLFSSLAIWAIAIWGLFGFDPSSIPLGYWMKCLAASFFVSACLLLASAKWRERRGESPWPADRWSLVMVVLAAVFMNPFPQTPPEQDWSIIISAVAPLSMMHLANSWPVHKHLAKRLVYAAQRLTLVTLFWPMAAIIAMLSGFHPPALKTLSSALLMLPIAVIVARLSRAHRREQLIAVFVVLLLLNSVVIILVYHDPGPSLAPILFYTPMHALAAMVAAYYARFKTKGVRQ